MALVGLISDTHGLLRPEAVAALQGVEVILHAGDIGSESVIEDLRAVAPVVAIRGNIDTHEWAQAYPTERAVEVAGKRIYLLHNLRELTLNPAAEGYDLVISGHSHKPAVYRENDVLFVNPGSAGRRRFKLPITVGRLDIAAGDVQAEILALPV